MAFGAGGQPLPAQAGNASAWATPKASDGEGGRTTKTEGGGNASADTGAVGVAQATPTVQDSENTAGPSQFHRNSHPLNVQAVVASWPTPLAQNPDAGNSMFSHQSGRDWNASKNAPRLGRRRISNRSGRESAAR